MHKPLLLATACLCGCLSYSQKKNTLVLFYKTDQYSISKQIRQKIDSFLQSGWDRIIINGYTDEVDDEGYNIELSKKRSGEVREYIAGKNFPDSLITENYFGETKPFADNYSEEGRAQNRRTEIIGFRFAKIALRPKDDPMKPVTKTLDNGFILTYRPGSLPGYLAGNFAAGSGTDFQLVTNTAEMRRNNMYNNTTSNEILSSVLIICSGQITPCKLDSPVLMKVPYPYNTSCPPQKIKFFNSYLKDGKKIWEEQNKEVVIETINGSKYMSVWVDNFCGCVNFDIKLPDCFDADTMMLFTKSNIRNLSAELKGWNSIYIPGKLNDSTHNLVYEKNKLKNTKLSFTLYNDKKAVRSFRDQGLEALPFDETSKRYIISSGKIRFAFPDLDIYYVNIKVNNDRYRTYPLEKACEFTYLNRKAEKITVDFMVINSRKRITMYHNQPLESIPYNSETGQWVIDKNFIRQLKEKSLLAGL